MKFTINRTSNVWDDKPCKEATPYKVTRVETRTLKTHEEFDKKFGAREGKWLKNGTNHRKIGGCIARDNGTKKCWAIELNSLEYLIALYRKYGALVIETNMWIEKHLTLKFMTIIGSKKWTTEKSKLRKWQKSFVAIFTTHQKLLLKCFMITTTAQWMK